ncbi:MAG: glycosyl hydrolase, partial [Phycisphaeraceae bacterium]|nr:glycosyl hydrolase [Phycisphaeraceae bacterium]
LGKRDSSNQGVHGTWMRDFMAEVGKRDLRVDTIGVHWYGGTSARHFKERMRKIYETYGERPLMITEFAPADWRAKSVEKNRHSPAKVLAFMKEVLPWMERQDWIAGYAWFPFPIDRPQGASSALFFPDGTLTACGRFYRSVTPENPDGDQSIKPDPPHHR